ncbi:hypothetical protein [Shewanella sp.]|uniref:hypothetical protein n=1 Tax=Shewanella sp. TaxID=50422 RepID=UPI002585325F|nr:hypothetical protein [Shewanella sp.]MCJ8305128.1 hypothetical protein [Shewanella sp.]NQY27667.1 hypothetical protein [Piscirickettsiaceae bacterium]
MGITLIILGLFLLFAFGFNGSVGTEFVNSSFVTSALLMILAGTLKTASLNWKASRIVCVAALVAYTPMIWQRFNYKFSVDEAGLIFDIMFVVFMLAFIINKPNKAIKKDV